MTTRLETDGRTAVGLPADALVGDPLGRTWTVSATATTSYNVRITSGLLNPANAVLEDLVFAGPSRRRMVVVDERVLDLYGGALFDYLGSRRLPADVVCMAVEENHKNMDLVLGITRLFDEFGLDRRCEPAVVLGGGVLLDAVGCAAGLYRRGTPYVRIPTTLIGLVDAGVGIKTGVNHNNHKNRIGSYHAPELTLLDPGFLRTLPLRHVSNGLAEIAKMGLMCDADLWSLLTRHAEMLRATRLGSTDDTSAPVGLAVIARAVHSMLEQLQPNLWESDLNRLVDFGHTFSPTLEMEALPGLLHGEAVVIDMAVSCAISTGRGLLPDDQLHSILATFVRLGLPLAHQACTVALLEHALADSIRHRGGHQRFPVPVRPGFAVFLNDVAAAEIAPACHRVQEIARRSC